MERRVTILQVAHEVDRTRRRGGGPTTINNLHLHAVQSVQEVNPFLSGFSRAASFPHR